MPNAIGNTGKAGKPKRTRGLAEPIDANRSYTTEQLCKAAQVSRWTVQRWLKAGLAMRDGRPRRFFGRDVIAFLHGDEALS